MTEQKGISFTSIIIGIGIGAIVVYLFLKNKNPNMTLSPSILSQPQHLDSNSIGLNALNKRMNLIEQNQHSIEQKLDILLPMNQLSTNQLLQSPMMTTQNQNNQMSQIQENEEECILKLNEKGRILGFSTHRKLFGKNS